MKYKYFDLSKLDKYELIEDVVVRPLTAHRDERGILVETIKKSWKDVYGEKRPFAQSYFSETKSNVARDEGQWHIHPTKQEDRFVVIKGRVVFALMDNRKDSSTYKLLNLFLMGEMEKDRGYYHLLVPQRVLHCFLVVSKKPSLLINFPTRLYDEKEEGRIDFKKVKLEDGSNFDWNIVRREFGLD